MLDWSCPEMRCTWSICCLTLTMRCTERCLPHLKAHSHVHTENYRAKCFLYIKKVYTTTIFIDVKVYLSLDYVRTRQAMMKHYGACVSYYIHNIWYILDANFFFWYILWIFYCHLSLLPFLYWTINFLLCLGRTFIFWNEHFSSLQWFFAGLLSSSFNCQQDSAQLFYPYILSHAYTGKLPSSAALSLRSVKPQNGVNILFETWLKSQLLPHVFVYWHILCVRTPDTESVV